MIDRSVVDVIRFFALQRPRRTAALVGLLIASGLTESIGIIALLPLLEATASTDTPTSALSTVVGGALGTVGLEPTVGTLLTVIVVLMIGKAGFYLFAMKFVGQTVADVTAELRIDYVNALMASRWRYFIKQPAGTVASAIGPEATWAANAYRASIAMIAAAIQAAFYAALAFLISWPIAIAGVLAGVFMFVVLHRLMEVSKRAGETQNTLLRTLLARLTDAVQGLKPLKAMNREHLVRPLLHAETRGVNQAQSQLVVATEAVKAAQEPIIVLLLALGLYTVLVVGSVPLATVLMMAFLFQRLVGRIGILQIDYQTVMAGHAAFRSLTGQIHAARSAQEQFDAYTAARLPVDGSVRFDEVSFAYGDNRILKQASFDIPPASLVALIGPSGSGKTTVADLIVGLLSPDAGAITVGGVQLRPDSVAAWRNSIGYVPQEMFLFNDTLGHNLTFGDGSISEADVQWALEAAGAWDFVQALPDGLNTNMGERGSRLSGGQRQRIALARALARRPKLLILDEVTTSLDPATEQAICDVLKTLSLEMTIVAISHQSKVKDIADIVLLIDSGGVTQTWKPNTLPVAAVSQA